MEKVTRFMSASGREFTTEAEAIADEAYWSAVVAITGRIDAAIKAAGDSGEANFYNGGGFVQLSAAAVKSFWAGYRAVVAEFHSDLIATYDSCPSGIIGRFLGDGNCHAYSLTRIGALLDGQCRLWGQPYFAHHPYEGKQICLGKVEA